MIALHLFGRVDLRNESGVSVSALLSRPKLAGILAYLAVEGDERLVRRDKLLPLFWPEHDDEHARGSLRTALHRIRSALAHEVIVTRGTEEIGIDPHVLWCDARAFAGSTRRGDCREALKLYAGDFLDAFHIDASAEFQAWIDDQRWRLRAAAAQCAQRLYAGTQSEGDVAGMLQWSRRELEITPGDEGALRNVLSALALAGETADAMEMFEKFTVRYRDEFGLELSPETRALVERIRAGSLSARATSAIQPVSAPAEHAVQMTAQSPAVLPAPGMPRRRVLMYAGLALTILGVSAGLRTFSFSSPGRISVWTRAQLTDAPLPRAHHSLVYDPESRQVMLFGGTSDDAILGDVWRLSLATDGSAKYWQRISAESQAPVRRWLHFAAYDPGDDTMIIVAGAAGHTTPCLADVWVLDNAMRGTPPLRWRKIDVAGSGPAPRAEFGAFYDAHNNRLVVQGGHDCIAPVFPDIWVLNLAKSFPARWSRITPAAPQGAPPPLRSQLMAYDAENNRAIVFGGMDGRYPRDAVALGDVWVLTNANGLGGRPEWVRPALRGDPIPPTSKAMGAYDPATNRLIVFGGYHNSGAASEPTADVWVLEGANGLAPHANWRKLATGGSSPGPRVSGAVVFDPNTERLILFGGYSKGKSLGDVWSLTAATGAR